MSPRWFRRDSSDAAPADVACIDFVELVTDYLDGALPAERVEAIDAHVELCTGCRTALDQFRQVITVAGRLPASAIDSLAPDVRAELVAAFTEANPADR